MDLDKNDITLADIMNHTKKHGSKATSMLMSILGRKRPLYDAVMSDTAKVLLKPMMERMDELLEKISLRENSQEEGIEYDVLRKILNEWAIWINGYQKTKDKLKGV